MLTVLMPVYNAMPFLSEALESVLSQSMGDLTLLALDGGSKDGSVELLRDVSDPRVKVVAFDRLGLGATLEYGLRLCETEFFARMDADDRCHQSRFAKQFAFLQTHENVGVVGTQFRYFGRSGDEVPSPVLPRTHEAIAKGLNEKQLTLVHGSLMGRTEALRRAGGYRVQGMGEDWDMFLRVSEVTRLANLQDSLYEWRLHSGNAELPHLMDQQIGIDFACECARRRREGLPEVSFDDFLREFERRPLMKRLMKRADVYSLAQYRIALETISEGRARPGYLRLAYSALCSPSRTWRRVRRVLQASSFRPGPRQARTHE